MISQDFLLSCVALVWRTLGKFGCDEAKLLPSMKRANDLCCLPPPRRHRPCRRRHHHRHRHLCLSHATMRIHLPLIAGISGNKGNERAASYGLIHQELIEASLVSSADRAGVVCAVLCARVCVKVFMWHLFFFSPPVALHCASVCVCMCVKLDTEKMSYERAITSRHRRCVHISLHLISARLSRRARGVIACLPASLSVFRRKTPPFGWTAFDRGPSLCSASAAYRRLHGVCVRAHACACVCLYQVDTKWACKPRRKREKLNRERI